MGSPRFKAGPCGETEPGVIECQPGSRAGAEHAFGAWMHSPAIRKVRVTINNPAVRRLH